MDSKELYSLPICAFRRLGRMLNKYPNIQRKKGETSIPVGIFTDRTICRKAACDFAAMDDEAYEISSELYEEHDYTSKAKPTINPKNVVSDFHFELPSYRLTDKEGDLLVARNKTQLSQCLEIEHSYSTSLDLVGLQLWRGSLLLADWLLDNSASFAPRHSILELGAGVGLTSVVAAMFAPVICTDVDRGQIFQIINANVNRNRHLAKHPVEVLQLDFTADGLPEKVLAALPQVKTVIAADVVYDDRLTEAFVKTVKKILDIPPSRSVLIALEKRYVFTISDCDTCAPCYEHFLEQLKVLGNVTIEAVPTDFPQYFRYDRCKELVLWKLTSKF
uniref:Methyltransferase-like protein 22 n=1 Tax=Dendroctonus ponderosae TaxID=77166 RepID=A0AAR5PZF8_DENPD